ncbi:glucooligosaccharide oxidase, putative [Talaromyces stipitatus ATCC 10500]|uniref:Glucooligosaccharide oxidase, putative n=1 Tax=Talaromyces stipitatus (strain ATCC 10500 / CBS 375.48 / QM 6759 / NRRL 1006) TaxID=441959 RepID=B8MB84_TALSN|nr:glucooligosaccharide oxidase, putative [Talaromyces stipitatus ATCC 10500]EED18873.1 glucooligosaccharide oxidase, putative [Talaromyces stipitatus ATCC 10500]
MGNTTSAVAQQCLLNAVGNDASLVAFPTAPLYESVDVNPYNLDYPVTPAAVTFPESAEQVSAIVKCAVDADVKVQAKSGGHSYGNYGLGGKDGAIVVDLRHFQQFSYDPATQYATIGAGTLLGDIDTRLHNAGGRAMTHGTSPQVGIGGHATIGGLGPTARQYGMALDHVESVQVVLANSSIVTASTTEYSDIFYAIRGAGASFGIVTEFTVRTEAEPGIAVQYQFTFNLGDTSSRANTFKAWQQFISDPSLPREFSCQLVLAEGILLIEGEFFGSLADFEALQLESRFPVNQGYNVTVFNDWLALVAAWGVQLGEDLTGGIPAHFYSKSLPFSNTTLIPDDVVDNFFEYIDTANKDTLLWFIIFDLEKGAISDVPVHATSYGHRDALFWLQSYAVNLLGPVSVTTSTFLNQVNNIFLTGMPNVTFGAYPGYVDRELTNGPEQYWGTNLERLIEIKSIVDPQDIFHNPQSVPLQ